MRRLTLAIALIVQGIVMVAAPAHGDNLRCGSKLAQTGDTREGVRKKCGDPAEVSHSNIMRLPYYIRNGRQYYFGNQLVEVPVEVWTYNFGPNKLMRRLRFVDGLLEDIETLGYGYNEIN